MTKFFEGVKNNLFFFLILITAAAYVLSGLTRLVESDQPISEIIGEGIITLILGWVIALLFGEQGITNGLNSKGFIATMDAYGDIVDKITPNIEYVGNFIDIENEVEYVRVITGKLRKAGISYNDFKKKNYDKKDKLVKKAVKAANKIKYGKYNVESVLSGIEINKDGRTAVVSIDSYKFWNNLRNFFTKIVFAVVFVKYGLDMIEPDKAAIIWKSLQVALFVTIGFLQYLKSVSFIVTKYRKQVINNTNLLHKFNNSFTKNPDIYTIKRDEKGGSTNGKVLESVRSIQEPAQN
jgi:hypothetical protein